MSSFCIRARGASWSLVAVALVGGRQTRPRGHQRRDGSFLHKRELARCTFRRSTPGSCGQVHVKAGDVVKRGQPLATLDPTFTQADLLQLQQKLSSDEAAVASAPEAEMAGRPYPFLPVREAIPIKALQGGIWQKRWRSIESNLSVKFRFRQHKYTAASRRAGIAVPG